MTSPAPDPSPDEPQGTPGPPALRASDADRERVATVVREAVGDGRLTLAEGDERLAGVYASIHRHELATYTADLGPAVPDADHGPAPRTERPPAGHRPSSTTSIAVMGGADRRGAWTPGHTHHALAVMGGAELDLRQALLGGQGLTINAVAVMGGVDIDLRGADIGAGGVTIQAFALMGGVNVLVDPETRVEEHGLGIMGGFADNSGAPARPDGPVVTVRGLALMGGVEIRRKPLPLAGGGRRAVEPRPD